MTVMANPAAGERARFLSPAGSPELEMLLELDPAHHGPPPHLHATAHESFTVLAGSVDVLLGRTWRRLEVGEAATVGPGTRHTYRGVPGTSARTTVRITPGGPMRAFLTDLYGLAAQGRLDAEGSLRLRDAARLFRRHPAAMSVAGVPAPLQRPLWWVLSPRPDRSTP